MFFADRYFGFDDAIYAGARLLELLSRAKQTLAELLDTLPVLSTRPRSAMTARTTLKFEVVTRARGLFASATTSSTSTACACSSGDGRRLGAGARVEHPADAGAALRGRQPERLVEIQMLVEGRLAQIMSEMGAPPPEIAAH